MQFFHGFEAKEKQPTYPTGMVWCEIASGRFPKRLLSDRIINKLQTCIVIDIQDHMDNYSLSVIAWWQVSTSIISFPGQISSADIWKRQRSLNHRDLLPSNVGSPHPQEEVVPWDLCFPPLIVPIKITPHNAQMRCWHTTRAKSDQQCDGNLFRSVAPSAGEMDGTLRTSTSKVVDSETGDL